MSETEPFEHDRRRRPELNRRASDKGARSRHNQTIAVSIVVTTAIITGLTSLTVLVGKKGIVSVMSDAMAGEITKQVQTQVAPLAAGFKVILQQNIDRLRREIGALEFKERTGTLTADEARLLDDRRIELDGQKAALDAIVASERSR